LNIVIPMAGAGSRFREAGYALPKMMIPAAGKPMLSWAIDSVRNCARNEEIVFICLKEHLEQFPLESMITEYWDKAKISGIDSLTDGQAQTVLAAADFIHPHKPLLIYNCDTYTESNIYPVLVRAQAEGDDGVISVFRSTDPCFSYVSLGPDGYAERLEEKQVISAYATTGLYYFSKASAFIDAAASAIHAKETVRGEYYIAPLINKLIKQGSRFVIHEADKCYPLGTPDQLSEFEKRIDASW